MNYQLNNEHVLNELYGDLIVEWHEDLLILRSIREAAKSKMTINNNAHYQLREIVPPRKKVSFDQAHFEEEEIKSKVDSINKNLGSNVKKFYQNVGPIGEVITKRNDRLKIRNVDYNSDEISDDTKYADSLQKLNLPSDSAIIVPKPREKLTTFANTSIYKNDMEKVSNDVIAPILAEIDPERLTTKRANKKNQSVYTLQEIQDFARRLGIPVSNKAKIVLIGNIKKMIEDHTHSSGENL